MPIIERLDGRSDKIDFLLLSGTTLVPELGNVLLSFDVQPVLETNENENLIFYVTMLFNSFSSRTLSVVFG